MAMKESPNLCLQFSLFVQANFLLNTCHIVWQTAVCLIVITIKNKLLSSKGKPLSVSYSVRNIVTFMQISFCLFLPLACGLAKHNSILVPIKIASISEFYVYGRQSGRATMAGAPCHNSWNFNH